MTHPPISKFSALVALGFTAADDGALRAPSGSTITLAPMGRFYQLTITLPEGNNVRTVVSDVALKISRGR